MAQKRMFDKTITNSDTFLDLPDSSQVLYFHLSMNADDDGFINNWKSIIRMTGTKEDDLKILIAKQFVIPFESGVIVIKHWRLNNFLRKDRHIPTKFIDEMASLELGDNEEYLLGQPMVNQWSTENRIDKNRIDKNNILYNNNIEQPKSDFELEFEALWEMYPNKKGKKDALKHYINARKKNVSYETIYNGLENYLKYIEISKTDLKYVKHGSSWFNQRGWEDDYSINETHKAKSKSEEQFEILKGVYDGTIKVK